MNPNFILLTDWCFLGLFGSMDSPTVALAQTRHPVNLSAPMRLDDFFQAFFAALRLQGVKSIDVRGDRHQRRFSKVADWLDRHPEDAERLGICFFPSPFNGRYADFDAELLKNQVGLLGAKNPFYPGIDLQFTPERAENILQQTGPENRALFSNLAKAFREIEATVEA
jgi:hypothetical protein